MTTGFSNQRSLVTLTWLFCLDISRLGRADLRHRGARMVCPVSRRQADAGRLLHEAVVAYETFLLITLLFSVK